jgi:hypothetical protein
MFVSSVGQEADTKIRSTSRFGARFRILQLWERVDHLTIIDIYVELLHSHRAYSDIPFHPADTHHNSAKGS